MNAGLNEKLNGLPCAYAIIKNDSDGTIIFANDIFYRIINSTQLDLAYRYGMRFSAILPVDDYMVIQNYLNEEHPKPLRMELPLKVGDDSEVWTLAAFQKSDVSDYYYALFVDIANFVQMKEERAIYEMKMKNIFEYANFDMIDFCIDTWQIVQCQCNMYFNNENKCDTTIQHCLLEDDWVLPEYHQLIQNCIEETKKSTSMNRSRNVCEVQMRNRQDEIVWTKLTFITYLVNEKKYGVLILTNIHAEKVATENYIEQSLFYQSMLNAQDAYGHIDITANCFMKMGGLWNLYNELINKISYSELYRSFIEKVVHPDDRAHYIDVMSCENITNSYENGITSLGCEFRRIVDQNKMHWMKIVIHPFRNPLNQHIMALMFIYNIDEQKKQLRTIATSAAQYDSLTKLYNRKTSSELIAHYLYHMHEQEICAVIIIDINNFRTINQNEGYMIGDKILLYLSNVITTVFRKRDIIGRYGDDEFIVLLKDVERVRLEKRLEKLFQIIAQQTELGFTICAGIVYAKQGDSMVNCIKQATIALYEAKKKKGTYIFFHNDESILQSLDEDEQFQALMNQEMLVEAEEGYKHDHSFDGFLSTEGDIAYLVNPRSYELILGNQSFYSRVGLTPDECIGRPCYEIIHKRQHPCPFCQKANWTTDKYNMYRNYNNALEQDFLVKNKLVSWNGETTLLAFAIDLSNDKSVVDLVDSGTTEDNYILNGIQNMQQADSIKNVIYHALETIVNYFRADGAHYWKYSQEEHNVSSYVNYSKADEVVNWEFATQQDEAAISTWINKQKWRDSVNIENPETMMLESYEMYQMMMRRKLNNSRWFRVFDNELTELGLIEIDNISINFQNVSFMMSFLTYMVTELKTRMLVENIKYHAKYDPLTGLLNRSSYEYYESSYDEEAVDSIAVIAADINGLSSINAMKGSTIGDYYLKQLGKYLREIFEGNSIFRLSGDEFQVILSNTTAEKIEYDIDTLHHKLEEFGLFTVSTGYALDSIEKKLKSVSEYATQSMLQYKRVYYSRMQGESDKGHYIVQNELLDNLKRGDYEMFLQPKVNSKTGDVLGAEALVRYRDKNGGIVPPNKYISQFEKDGLIRYIDLFMFEEVCKVLERWTKQGITCPIISLNFSRITMTENNLTSILEAIITKYQVSRKYIEIEITESFADVGKVLLYQSAKRIHKAGYAVALDDFGTDFTNLSILSDIHVDVLKIDKSLIHSMVVQSKNQIILKNVIQMCRDLDIEVIAEGVEDKEQCELLKTLGCYMIQGYLYSKPIPMNEFERDFLNKTIHV